LSRSVPEWIGATDDTPTPARVKLRVKRRANSCCEICFVRAERGDTDHIEPVVFSTKERPLNRENNLQWLCINHHKSKTRKDVADKALAAKRQKQMAGIKEPSAWAKRIAWMKEHRGWKPKWT
jgi:5-methylcytosine-specific restriction protein A